MFFFFLAEMKVYITTFTLTALLQEMTDNLTVYMVTQERMGSSEAVVIYFASIKYRRHINGVAFNILGGLMMA